jgi:Tfp pilus assembly protein PilO
LRNDTAVTNTPGGARADMRTRFDRLRIARRRSALGLPEALALGLAALVVLATVLAYLFLLVPQRSRRQSLETERGDLQRLLQIQQKSLGESKDTQQRVGDILTSLDRFQTEHLGEVGSGTKTIIEELNRLILKNGLRISGGVSYTQLQESAPGAEAEQTPRRASGEETAARVVQSIFPGIGVTLTVEGTYPNLRRFIRDIEADNQFVVINTVELEGVSDSNAGPPVAATTTPASPANPEGPMPPPAAQTIAPSRGALVSLRLDMAAYFRRASAAAQ